MQTIVVEQDRYDPERVMVTVREPSGFGLSVRVEKAMIPQLIKDLSTHLATTLSDLLALSGGLR